MDANFFSHLMLWIVGGITAVGGLGLVAALFSMGRQGSRKY
ncbi:hypothetical protein ACFXQA_07760 [Microbacterium sp. P07]